ncbi:MAG: nucleoside phosphorylase [Bacteroidota bacterium]
MSDRIAESELIINPDGSIYHLNVKPGQLADTIIFVGDQNRVPLVSKHFDTIEHKLSKREFVTHTGSYKGKRLSVISTGIGPDNIDIVFNEIDALFNIDFKTRTKNKEHKKLNIVRIGTSGSLQDHIPVDSFVLAEYGIGFDGVLHYYDSKHVQETAMQDAFVAHTKWDSNKARPYIVKYGEELGKHLISDKVVKGFTGTAIGFYGPQGRVLRLPLQDVNMNHKIDSFEFEDKKITNLEMETAVIYGIGKMLGHNACSLNCIIANRANGTFSEDPYAAVEELIKYTLNKLADIN